MNRGRIPIDRGEIRTFDRTVPSYSVFLCTAKCSTVILCSYCHSPNITNGMEGLHESPQALGTFFKNTVTLVPTCNPIPPVSISFFSDSRWIMIRNLNALLSSPPADVPFRPLIILKLEDPAVVQREVLEGVPWARPEGPEPSIARESLPGGYVVRRVDLIGEFHIGGFLLLCGSVFGPRGHPGVASIW